jgi:hypothetical protein
MEYKLVWGCRVSGFGLGGLGFRVATLRPAPPHPAMNMGLGRALLCESAGVEAVHLMCRV